MWSPPELVWLLDHADKKAAKLKIMMRTHGGYGGGLGQVLKTLLAVAYSTGAVFVVGSHISDGITHPPGTFSLRPLDLLIGLTVLGFPWSLPIHLVFAALAPANSPPPVASWWLLRMIMALGAATLLNVVLLWWWALRKGKKSQ